MIRQAINDYHVDELLGFATALNFRLDVASAQPDRVNSPAMSGRIFAETIQPGLSGTGYDLAYAADIAMRQEMSRSLIVAVLVAGEADPMTIEGVGTVEFRAGRPLAMAMGDRSECSGSCSAGGRCAMAGLVLQPAFFDGSEDEDDDSLSPLQALVEGRASVHSLTGSGSLSEIAAAALSMPYEGRLGRLFQESATLALLAETARLAKAQAVAPAGLSARQFERMLEAKRLIDSQILAVPSFGLLARKVGVSPSTLRAHFKDAFGLSVFAYVRESRMQLSRRLLRSRELSITEVGYQVGFSNPAAFATAFRRRFGYPPSGEAARA